MANFVNSSSGDFVELLTKSCFSFLHGASHPSELIHSAAALGYRSLALTDTHGVYGLPQAHAVAEKLSFHLIVGAETHAPNGQRLCFLVETKTGYANLGEILTLAHDNRDNPNVAWAEVAARSEGLTLLLPHPYDCPPSTLKNLREAFAGKLYLVASLYSEGSDGTRLKKVKEAETLMRLPVVASLEPLYHTPHRKKLQDVLTCIHHQCEIEKAGLKLLPNDERHLKPPAEVARLFADYPEWVAASRAIADRCTFSLKELKYRYPDEWLPPGETQDSFLHRLTWEGAKFRYPDGIPAAVEKQVRHELTLIKDLEYGHYFLTIWDIIQFALREKILFQGRGSAANSVVCYFLGITAIDPVRMNLLFERFVSRERKEPPDIDIDFEHERREEVIQYIYSRYGRDRAAITANTICFRRRSSLREVGKVLGIPISGIEKVQTLTHRRDLRTDPFTVEERKQIGDRFPLDAMPQFFELAEDLAGFPRHLGTHVGGFVLCQDKLTHLVPVEKAAMKDRTIIQWNKDDLDTLDLVKVDILGLGILTCIRKTFTEIKNTRGKEYTLANIPPEDKKVYEQIARGDTVGIFQIESRAQMNMLPRLKPKVFYDLVIEVAIVRPGPIQGEMVHPYLRRRAGLEEVTYPHPELEAILKKTYGVPLFQEQIMKMAMTVAGFTAGEADELRRAMGTWRNHGGNRLSPLGEKFKRGLMARGIPQEFADRVFQQIEGFAEYGFPESHAASFALLAYATAYLRHYYPDCYLAGILNALPMGFYQSSTLVYDAVNHGVKMLPLDAKVSKWDNFVERPGEVRLGFREVRGLNEKVGRAVELAREKSTTLFSLFENIRGQIAPDPLKKRDLFLLAAADAFKSFGLERREAMWEIQGAFLRDAEAFSPEEDKLLFPEENKWEQVAMDYSAKGVSLTAHPMSCFRDMLKAQRVLDSKEVLAKKGKSRMETAGLVICRQMPPTAKGVLFITLEDEHGFINLVIWRKVFEQYRELLSREALLRVRGEVQKTQGTNVTHVIVREAFSLLQAPDNLRRLSHDWG